MMAVALPPRGQRVLVDCGAVLALALLVACGRKDGGATAPGAATSSAVAELPAAVNAMGVTTQSATLMEEITGKVGALREVASWPQVGSIVTQRLLEWGQPVRDDQMPSIFDPRQYQAAVEKAGAELDLASSELNRRLAAVQLYRGVCRDKGVMCSKAAEAAATQKASE